MLIYHLLILLAVAYAGCLFIVNLIPHIRVKAFGWFSLCGVTITFPEATISAEKVHLKLSANWKSLSPFRLVTLRLNGVVVTKKSVHSGKKSDKSSPFIDIPLMSEEIQFLVPNWAYKFLLKKSWLNEFSIQLYHVSFYHHAVEEDISLHLDYVKVDGFSDEKNCSERVSISILDGYVNDASDKIEALHLFHNLEVSVKCIFRSGLPSKDSKKSQVSFSNFDILFIVGLLRIRNLSKLLERKKKNMPKKSPGKFPSFGTIFSNLNMISSIQLKLEQSVIEFKEVRILSSSYSLNYFREKSYKKQTMAKVSSYVTAAQVYHLGLKCLDLPSVTYILDIDLSDFHRAADSSTKEKFTVDLFTTLSLTNPSFFVYFDQLDFLLDLTSPSASSDSSKKIDSENNLLKYLTFIRKSSVKFNVVDLKGQLHMPKEEKVEFLRRSIDNVVCDTGAQALVFKFSSKNLGNLILRRCMSSAPITLKSFLKLRNLHVEVEENTIFLSAVSALIGYCLDTHKIALRVTTKKLQLKSVNTMIFEVVRKVREAKISSLNRACGALHTDKDQPDNDLSVTEDQIKTEQLNLFEILPPIFHSIKFRASLFLSYVICNDGLPLHVIYDKVLDEDIDLADFKRGASFMASGLDIDYKRKDEVFEARLKQVEVNTLSDYSSEYFEDFDNKSADPLSDVEASDTSSLESGLSDFSLFEAKDNVKTVKKVLSVEDIILRNPPGNPNKLSLSIPQVEGRSDIYLVWCVLYAYTLVELIAPRVEKTYSKEQAKRLGGVSKIVDLDVEIGSLSVVARLPHDVDVLLEIDSFSLKNAIVSPHCQISYLRLYVVHPTTKLWSRLVSITNTDVDFNTVSRNSVFLTSDALRFNIPFQFLVYTVIDNVITFFKAAIQIRGNFKHLSKDINTYKKIEPEAKAAVKIPRVQLKSKIMGITLENDDFETQLALIYQFGAIENVERRRKLAVFEKKAEELRSQTTESLSKSPVENRRFLRKKVHKRKGGLFARALFNSNGDNDPDTSTKVSKKSGLKEIFCEGKSSKTNEDSLKLSGVDEPLEEDNLHLNYDKSLGSARKSALSEEIAEDSEPQQDIDQISEEDTEAIISDAYEELLRDFSNSWINKFEKYKFSHFKSWEKRMENVWGPDNINKLMKSKFDIQEYSRGPPQFQGVFNDLDLIVDDPNLEDIDEFLRIHGKGQPHLEYSILVPAFIHWRSSSVYMSLRDYALPFISFPSSGDPDLPVMDLKGTFVINEKLVSIPEELRQIFVPFSPATKALQIVDNFYSVSVVRTLTPVKVMFDLESTLNTDRACVISWCKSYQPALLSAMMAFENFTKPEIDDSPLGWWDKMALIAHGKVKFNIKNELCLHMKSSLSPYSLIGNSSGLVFCWKDNVLLRINDTGKQSELVILESDDFILGIPNYSATEGRAWSLLNSSSNHDNDDEMEKFQKRVMKLTSDEKVIWKLGFLFERNKDKKAKELSANMERTDRFKPHYEVTVTGPQYDYHPDSYEEFRSDYTHLAMSVNSSSKKGNSHNYAYLTPLTMEYFKVWWKTLNDGVSLPIREGKLFQKLAFDESSVKFGPHLFSLKYQLVIEPLTVSDVYLSSGGKDTDHNVLAYGLKGKVEKCSIDLHQRREIARYVNEKLGIDKKVRQLKMNLGEVEVSEADLRLIFARFDDVSMTGKLLSYYSGESTQVVDVESFEKLIRDHEKNTDSTRKGLRAEEKDLPWVDFDDFVEMEEHDILSPNTLVEVIPFFSTPKFTYFREFTLEHPEGRYPFGKEPSHACLIGVNSPGEIRAQLVDLRVNDIKAKLNMYLEKAEEQRKGGKPANDTERRHLEKEVSHWQKKVQNLNKLRETYANSCSAPSINEICKENSRISSRSESTNDLKKHLTQAVLVYSGIDVLEQAREVINTNSLLSNYHNRFLIHNLKLKWSNRVRDVFTSFLSISSHRKTEGLAMTRKALDLMDKLLKSSEQKRPQSTSESSFVTEDKFSCGEDVIQAFEEYLTSLESDTETIEPNYLVKFINPQAHFQSDVNPKACVLMVCKDVELRVLRVNQEGTDDIITESEENTSMLETRYGLLCRDAYVLAFNEDEYALQQKELDHKQPWPPWVYLEDGDNLELYEKNLVFEKNTMALSLKKPNMLAIDTRSGQARKTEIVVHIPKLVIDATSVQYCAFYFILTDLLIHGTEKNYFLKRIEQISSVSEASDFADLAEKIKLLQNNIRICRFLILKMSEKSLKLSEQKRKQNSHLKFELCRMKIELCIIIKSLETKCSNYSGLNSTSSIWTVHVDQLIFHLLNDDRSPFIDFAFAKTSFTRLEEANGANANSVEVSMMQGLNLQRDAVYPELLRPFMGQKDEKRDLETYDSDKPMVAMNWKMLNPVGGIRMMSNAELLIQPIQIQLDYDTTIALFSYLFPKDEVSNGDGNTHPKDDNFSMYGSDTDDESIDSHSTLTSPSKKFKNLWSRSKGSKSNSPSVFTRNSSLKDNYSGESTSVTSNEGPLAHVVANTGKHSSKKDVKRDIPDDISLIMKRSAQYFVVGDFKVKKTKLCISFKAPKHLNIIDVHNLEFSLPQIHYMDKTWTSDDFVQQLKKDVVKIFLSNAGKIIGNKFKLKRRKRVSTPLRQISDFSLYMTLEDLQEEVRRRDSMGSNQT